MDTSVAVLGAVVVAVTAVLVNQESGKLDEISRTSQQCSASVQGIEALLAEEKRLRHQLEIQLKGFESKLNQLEQNSASPQNLLTLIAEEKRLRHQLEDRLDDNENEISALMNKSAVIDQKVEHIIEEQQMFVGFSVKLRGAVFNDGSVFDDSIGVFVCKQPGIYFLTLSFVNVHTGSHSICCISQNGHRSPIPCAAAGDTTFSNVSTGTTSGMLKLGKGDRVAVGECSHPEDMAMETTFTGFLLKRQ